MLAGSASQGVKSLDSLLQTCVCQRSESFPNLVSTRTPYLLDSSKELKYSMVLTHVEMGMFGDSYGAGCASAFSPGCAFRSPISRSNATAYESWFFQSLKSGT